MPLTSSAKKALRVDRRRKLENDLVRAKIKGAIKSAKLSVTNQASDIAEKLQSAQKELDLAVKKNVIHKNKAARLKSRLAKAVGKAEVPAAPVKKSSKAKAKAKAKSVTKKTTKKK